MPKNVIFFGGGDLCCQRIEDVPLRKCLSASHAHEDSGNGTPHEENNVKKVAKVWRLNFKGRSLIIPSTNNNRDVSAEGAWSSVLRQKRVKLPKEKKQVSRPLLSTRPAARLSKRNTCAARKAAFCK